MNKVAVIMGAGASYDVWNGSTPRDRNWIPPLAKELFASLRSSAFFPVAEPYDGAKVAWSMLSPRSAGPDAFDLEAALREMASDSDPRIQRAFREVPPYLRDLLQRVDDNYVPFPTTHVEFLSKLRPGLLVDAAFITLNYDCYIERALMSFDPSCQFSDIDSYWRNPVKVFKIHGSIDWAVPMTYGGATGTHSAWTRALRDFDPEKRGEDVLKIDMPKDLRSYQLSNSGNALYPVLTAPLASKGDQDIVCPLPHKTALSGFLRDCHAYLVVGSSGLDDDLLELLRSQAAVADILHVVAGDKDQANDACARYRKVEQLARADSETFGDGFVEYIRSPGLVSLLNRVRGLLPI